MAVHADFPVPSADTIPPTKLDIFLVLFYLLTQYVKNSSHFLTEAETNGCGFKDIFKCILFNEKV